MKKENKQLNMYSDKELRKAEITRDRIINKKLKKKK